MYKWLKIKQSVFLLILLSTSLVLQASASLDTKPLMADDIAPTVKFNGLRHYSRTSTQIPLSVQASDDVGISRIELWIDQVLISTNNVVPNLPSVTVNFNWNATANGKHIFFSISFII